MLAAVRVTDARIDRKTGGSTRQTAALPAEKTPTSAALHKH
jgi:hypothetical protein